jgi:hypothetical protein
VLVADDLLDSVARPVFIPLVLAEELRVRPRINVANERLS